jgi:hypothetical protein
MSLQGIDLNFKRTGNLLCVGGLIVHKSSCCQDMTSNKGTGRDVSTVREADGLGRSSLDEVARFSMRRAHGFSESDGQRCVRWKLGMSSSSYMALRWQGAGCSKNERGDSKKNHGASSNGYGESEPSSILF